jgi:hypothetical protein
MEDLFMLRSILHNLVRMAPMVPAVLLLSMVVSTPSVSHALKAKVRWDPNQPAPKQYRIYQRTANRQYNFRKPVWRGSRTSAVIKNLNKGKKYYFVVRAFNGRKEGPSSTEVSFPPESASPADSVAVSATAPTVTPNGGKFKQSAKVTLRSPTRGARIYYTTNGRTPTTRSTRYRKPFWLKRNTTLKAIAVAPGFKNSQVVSKRFIKSRVATAGNPSFTPSGGVFDGTIKVTLATPTRGARIYYTTNGKTPTTRSPRYTRPVTINRTRTIKAIAVAPGHQKSAVTRTTFNKTSAATSPDSSRGSAATIIGSSRAFGGNAWTIPGIIEAENFDLGGEGVGYHDTTRDNRGRQYRKKEGVDIWRTRDTTFTGANLTGEWLAYTVNVQRAGTYSLDLRVATPQTGRRVRITSDGRDLTGPIRIPATGGPTQWKTVMTTVKLRAGKQVIRVKFDRGGLKFDRMDIDPIGNGGLSSDASSTPGKAPVAKNRQQSFTGTPVRLPGTIEAENYDRGGEGVAYHDTTRANKGGFYRKEGVDIWRTKGGYYTGAYASGEWLAYTVNVAYSGKFKVNLRVATSKNNRQVRLRLDNKFITGPIRIPNTGSPNRWRTVSQTVRLNKGKHVLRVDFVRGGLNLDWLDIY